MLTRLRKREKPTAMESPELTHISRHAGSCFRYRSGQVIRCVPIIRCERRIRAAMVDAYDPKETREIHRNGTPELDHISRHASSCFHYRSGRPIHRVPIIRCGIWILTSLVNAYTPAETREIHRAGISRINSYCQKFEFLFHYRSGHPIRRGPIIRCDRWIRAALVNAYTPYETREILHTRDHRARR